MYFTLLYELVRVVCENLYTAGAYEKNQLASHSYALVYGVRTTLPYLHLTTSEM